MARNNDTTININFDEKKFKKFNGEHIEDIAEYIKNYVNGSKTVKIMVGCDSKQKRSITSYSVVIVLYDEFRNNGAHVIYIRVTTPRIKDLFTRLMNEAMLSLSLSEWLDNKIEKFYFVPEFELNEYDGSQPYRRIEIHVDVNPLEGLNKKNKSNMAYNAVMGMLCGSGFSVKSKPIAYAASTAADLLCQ
jgi:predicted RNase H-related nuclease YkuK (DUF458 family)